MRRWIAATASAALLAAGCAAPPRQAAPPVAPAPVEPAPVEQALEAISADARRSEQEREATVRSALAEDANRQAAACLARAPQAAACLYGHALALGLEARAHPARAGESLKRMLAELAAAEAADPDYDQAGPARVQALVLTRAPGWPLGPGDAAAGVVAAQRAVALHPHYPPNLLALAEALARSGDARGAHETYRQALDAALAEPASTADRDEWLHEADRGMQR